MRATPYGANQRAANGYKFVGNIPRRYTAGAGRCCSGRPYGPLDSTQSTVIGGVPFVPEIRAINPFTGSVTTRIARPATSLNPDANFIGIVTDNQGRIYAGDFASGQIYVYSSGGAFLGTFANLLGTTNSNEIDTMTRDFAGNIYVAQNSSNRLAVFSSSGVFQGFVTHPSFNRPNWVSYIPNYGSIYVGNVNDGNVTIFTNSGVQVVSFGGWGVGIPAIAPSDGCQVPARTKFFQGTADPPIDPKFPRTQPYPNTSPVPQYFGSLPPNLGPYTYTLCPTVKSGCLVSATATMLTSFASLANEYSQNCGKPFCGLTLLDTEIQGVSGYDDGVSFFPNQSPPPTFITYPDRCEVNPSAPQLIAPNIVEWIDSQDANPNFPVFWDFNLGATVSLDQYLTDHLCGHQDRVILKLAEKVDGIAKGSHFVYVTGHSAIGDWNVHDPGWQNAPPTLGGHEAGFTASGAFRTFQVAGVRTYRDISKHGNRSALAITANSPVELLVTDPQGRRVGNFNGNDIFEVPEGSYVRDFPLADDVDIGTANGDPTGVKTVGVPSPLDGVYQVTATGTGLGMYTLRVRTLGTDGSIQNASVSGVTNSGSIVVYELALSSTSGLTGSVVVQATFQSALADINNSLQVGLIDNAGIANSLSAKITAASDAAARGDSTTATNVLNAFKNQIAAQTGKHITGVAPQVLKEDADSLISQLPNK